jgi:hypothetical protein
MRHLDRLGSLFSISIPPDDSGSIGRECPAPGRAPVRDNKKNWGVTWPQV